MYTQSTRIGRSQAIPNHRARGGTPQGRGAPSASALTLSGLHALVANLESRMLAQEKKIALLEQENSGLEARMVAQEKKIAVLEENSDLWQEIHRLKGPRFPPEIFLLIINSARGDEEALKTFSLVCKSWMSITREILFARITLSAVCWSGKVKPVPILNNPHCTVFPHVRAIIIDYSTTMGAGFLEPTWIDDYLVHMPKFSALTSLELYSLRPVYLDAINRAMPPTKKRGILRLVLYPEWLEMSAIAAFVSSFTDLKTLRCGGMDESLTYWLGANEPLVPPPSSLTKLVLGDSGHLSSAVLKWCTDLHSGVIKSLSPHELPTKHPVIFRDFIHRFAASLSDICLPIRGNGGAVHFLNAQYFTTLSHLRSIMLHFWDFELQLAWLPTIIAQLPPSIEDIGFFTPDLDPLSCHKSAAIWFQLDHALLGGTLPSLRSLTIVCDLFWKEKEALVKEMWPQLLPRFAEKRVLAVKVPKDFLSMVCPLSYLLLTLELTPLLVVFFD
ncbi:hypothetical protein MVEN_01722700 [Mycena venus]|uniref:F-box domain-containing protein n=1 Tax=Mycena venus TaxID=2733690 RepID=A0A8H6XJV3_9AGAR|nr:hypothetical protein MVEN_01722700 [Mycena venus]